MNARAATLAFCTILTVSSWVRAGYGQAPSSTAPEDNAAPPPLDVEASAPMAITTWDAPGDCLDLNELRRRVREQSPAGDEGERSIQGRANRTETGWAFEFMVEEAGRPLGKRVLTLPSAQCRDHDEAIVLVAVLLLEHGPAEVETAPLEDPEPASEPSPSVEAGGHSDAATEVPDGVSSTRPPSRGSRLVRIALFGSALYGWLPGLALAPSASIGLRPSEYFTVEIEGRYFPRRQAEVEGGRLFSTAGQLSALVCGDAGDGALHASACVGGGWLSSFSQAEGVLRPSRANHHSGVAVGLLRGAWRVVEPWEAFFGVEVAAPFSPARFAFARDQDLVQVHETSSVLAAARLGVALWF